MENNKCEIEESGLHFIFEEGVQAVKFDNRLFYRNDFNKMPFSKGVDILADSREAIQMIEIKNCTGHEVENMWRTSVDNSKISSAPQGLDVENRDSLDIEVARKVASTITCLYRAWSKSERSERAAELATFWKGLCAPGILKDKKKLLVILFLEGDFSKGCPKTRSKKMMMKRIQDSINAKLAWLNCQVSVVDSDTYKERWFMMEARRQSA